MIVAEPFLPRPGIELAEAACSVLAVQGKSIEMKSAFYSLLAIGLLLSSGCYRNLTCNSCQQSETAGVVPSTVPGTVRPASVGYAAGESAHFAGNEGRFRGGGGFIPRLPAGYEQAMQGPAGPPTAAYAYPYYTIRGPRDFLIDQPPTIGR